MKTPLLLILSLIAPAASADDLRPPRNVPAAFQTECASCHMAFPPQLLSANAWRRVMRTLDKHYGDNASLDAETRQEIETFLIRNAGGRGMEVGSASAGLPRITQTNWFLREHREVGPSEWKHPAVKTPSNCAACHSRAAQGSYREREIMMPGGQRRED